MPTTNRSRAGTIWWRWSMPSFLRPQPARPGSRLERQPPASLSPGQRPADALDLVGCQQTATGGGLCRDLRPGGQPARPADAPRRQGHGAADRFDPHPARQAVRLGQVERAHPRHEDACRLRPEGRLSARPRHHRRQRQRRPDRPHRSPSSGRHLRVRQGLLPLRLVDGDRRRRIALRHPAQDQHGAGAGRRDVPVVAGAGRWLHRPGRQ